MSSVDQRVVEMKFDKGSFSTGVQGVLGELDKLKNSLKLEGASKGLDEVSRGVGQLEQQPGRVAASFTAMQAIAFGALASIGAKAVQIGQMLVTSLTIDPISGGLREYETNLNSIQTILANTKASGAGLPEVNAALKQLNDYSDETIYNFSEMARNIGTFTAAGVGLEPATAAIKGIANLAALSGSNSQQAAGAMYQLSQAISAGRVSLMDWNSVVNAGMGGTVFQRALAQTAVAMGQLDEHAVALTGDMQNVSIHGKSFRDSIDATAGPSWLTSDVLTTTLQQFTGDLTDAELAAQGFTDAQIASIQETARTAHHAATEVKTLSGVFDVAKETVGSGWAQTWQIIFGDFEEAKSTFTGFSDFITDFIKANADARNKVLGDWKELGGRTELIQGLQNAFTALAGVLGPIGQAFRDIFPATTGQQLYNLTVGFRDLMASLRPTRETSENLRRTFAGLFAVLGIVWELVKAGVGFIARLIGSITKGTGGVLEFTGGIGDFLVALHDAIQQGDIFGKFFDKLATIIEKPIELIKRFIGAIAGLFTEVDPSAATDAVDSLRGAAENLSDIGDQAAAAWEKVVNFLDRVWDKLSPIADKIKAVFLEITSAIGDFVSSLTLNDIIAGVATGGFAVLVATIRNFIKDFDLSKLFGGDQDDEEPSFLSKIKEALEELTETLQAMQNALNAGALLAIAAAIGILTLSVVALSKIDADDLTKSITAIGVMMGELIVVAKQLSKMDLKDTIKIVALGAGLTLLAIAVRILASAVKALSDLDWAELAKGVSGVTALLVVMAGVVKLMSGKNQRMLRTAAALILLAAAIKILASAVEDLSGLSWEELAKGVAGVATLLLALGLFAKFADTNNIGIGNGIGIILLATAIKILASAMKDISDLDWNEIAKGLTGMAVGLAAIAVALRLLPDKNLLNSVAIVIVAAALKILASAIEDMSKLSWAEIAKGLTTLSVSLIAIAAALKLLPRRNLLNAAALLVVTYAIGVLADALSQMGDMSWEEIARALVTLAGSLLVITLALKFIQGGVLGAAALLIVAYSLGMLADALADMGGMSWSEIAKALVTLAGALLIIGIALVAMEATVLGAAALIGVAFALDILADVLVKLGDMSWSDIGAAIGALALLFVVLAIGGVLSPLILLLAIALTALAGAIALAGAGILAAGVGFDSFADAMEKLSKIDSEGIDNITRAFQALIDLLPSLATSMADAIANFITTLGERAPEMATAVGTLITAMLKEITDRTPEIVTAFMDMITQTLRAMADRAPELIDAGSDLIVSTLDGIANNMPRIVSSGADVIIAFLNGIGDNTQRVVDAGFQMIVDVMNGIADSIRRNSQAIRDAAKNIGNAIIEGITGGVNDRQGGLMTTVRNLATNALNAMKNVLGIKSPSTAFGEVGMWSVLGVARGFDRYASVAVGSAENVGNDILTAMGTSISGLGDLINENIDDLNPVITPVLDLSTIRRDSSLIGGLLGDTTLNTDAAYSRASDASLGVLANKLASAQLAEQTRESFSFTQNNYSPKALSQAELYRQTNNQLSIAKGGLTNAN